MSGPSVSTRITLTHLAARLAILEGKIPPRDERVIRMQLSRAEDKVTRLIQSAPGYG